ncbi:class I mannose-6-phosphate isomerase [Paenibacillus yonginensis]|nr:class I mannose-6-phosphate isomerase [Paenibacillus yonginensis]
MKYGKYHNYDLEPALDIQGWDNHAFSGWEAIRKELGRHMDKCRVFVFDLYPGTDKEEAAKELALLSPALMLDCETCLLPPQQLEQLLALSLPQDPVFGVMFYGRLENCFDPDSLDALRTEIERSDGPIFLYGTGASLVTKGDMLVYLDLPRWEIQLRYRRGMTNWLADNPDAPILEKYKRGFFVEWRIADRHKSELLGSLDYLIETTSPGHPNMVSGNAFRSALKTAASRPFRLKPYFDPGVWGGQWMKENFGLPEGPPNYAWSFDGVPEENSLQFRFGQVTLEIPAIDLVLFCPRHLLGERVHARFGAEFPIRFDLLDTIEGGNLSLQVHPLTEYIGQTFGMHYTQDESYYILDAAEDGDACVYLGLKENVDSKRMASDLYRAKSGKALFPAEEYVNKIPVKKHDHVLIPAGTIHCSGKNTMVLEISATPYIFTFKLWDWGRMGLDGLPRPTHLEHGLKNIQWDWDTPWVKENLIHQEEVLEESGHHKVERTGLHTRQFIDTFRYTFSESIEIACKDSVQMLNLVDGGQITISSKTGAFPPFDVHYAETAVVPAAVDAYSIQPSGISEGETVMIIVASVR